MARHKGIYKRKESAVYWIRYALPDGTIRRESAKTTSFKEASDILTDKRKVVRDGNDPTPTVRANVTFAELAPKYLEWAKRQKSYKGKSENIEILKRKFGNVQLSRFSTLLLEQFQTELLGTGNRYRKDETAKPVPLKPATVNRYMATLKHMIRKAVEWEMVGEDTLKRSRRAAQLPENNQRDRYLEPEERATYVAQSKEHFKTIATIAVNTGMRLGEILSLEWEKNIDLRSRLILLTDTKNGTRRQVPINDDVYAVLSSVVRRVDVPYVFFEKDRKGIKRGTAEKDWKRIGDVKTAHNAACRRAGIKGYTFHDNRHTFAAHYLGNGGDLFSLSQILGHKNIKMTMRYSRFIKSHFEKAAEIMNRMGTGKTPTDTVCDTVAENALHSVGVSG